jgi:hypothetical protein
LEEGEVEWLITLDDDVKKNREIKRGRKENKREER